MGGREILRHTADYLGFVRDVAAAAHARQLTALQAAHEVELGPYSTLTDSERIVGNLERAFAELRGLQRGSPIDHPATFAEMVTFNGGKSSTLPRVTGMCRVNRTSTRPCRR